MSELYSYLTSFESATNLFFTAIQNHGLLAVLMGVFLLGETVIITSLILTQQGVLDLSEVIVASTIGSLLADLFWFVIGRYHPQNLIPKSIRENVFGPTSNVLTSLIRGRYFLALLFLQFFIGTRLMIILYLSRQKISPLRFAIYDCTGTFIYLIVFSILGLYLGQTINEVLPTYKLTTSIITGILVITLITIVSRNMMRKLKLEQTSR
ncbi:MAG: hypothetical protein KC877_02450 [Candidatus Kaiserbacteria bacterium]|nr:hypothetical protein [Candidatus Kaiserbacteria bacterium]MCB9816458.1 hypothetical protein [Candidatus Nomurabacteria bacterium]